MKQLNVETVLIHPICGDILFFFSISGFYVLIFCWWSFYFHEGYLSIVLFSFNVFIYFCYQVSLLFYKGEASEPISYLPAGYYYSLSQACIMRDVISGLIPTFYEYFLKFTKKNLKMGIAFLLHIWSLVLLFALVSPHLALSNYLSLLASSGDVSSDSG